MVTKALARWAALVALAAPLAVSAQDRTDKDRNTDEAQRDKDRDKKADESTPGTKEKAEATKLTSDELQIIGHIHRVNQMEIDMGRMAQRQASAQAVKDYGKTLIQDHNKADTQIISLVKRHKQALPKASEMPSEDMTEKKSADDMMDHLKSLKGADFDRELLNMAVQGHEKELTRTDTAIGMVTAPDLKSLLQDLKPVLQRHADKARDLQKSNPQARAEPGTSPSMPKQH
jgi:putative membrane protein